MLKWIMTFAVVGCTHSYPAMSPEQAAGVAQSALCEKTIREKIASNNTCPAAQLAINSAKECHSVFPLGLDLDCPEYRR